ncbi:MAG: hypothetical protein JSU06_05790 [Actinobacteria bacterium]|nr:hypothetical protein [Actinomycetota bacterium]
MNDTRLKLQTATALALLVAAVGLWLSTDSQSRAASANQTQSVSAAVTSTISWGSVGLCTQSMGAAAFGSLAPGASATAPGGVGTYTGCVSSNAQWNVTGTMTTAPSAGAETIPASAFRVESASAPTGSQVLVCPAANSKAECTLNNAAVNFVSKAPATPAILQTALTNGFTYSLKLTVPEGQPAGTYENGVVTLTASNG